jgi:uncharacterized protein
MINCKAAATLALLLATAALAGPAKAQTTPPRPAATQVKPQEKAEAKKPELKPDPAKAAQDIKDALKLLDQKAYAAAIKSFSDGFALGDPDGAFYLGRMVELGVGVQANFDKAHALYLAAADKGSAKAMNRLGLMAWRGEHMLQDYKAAAELICKGAEKGDADALFNCAGLYAEGRGVDKDLAKAVSYYERAAGAGHIGALNALGFAYKGGVGVAADPAKARDDFEKAANKGNPVGLYELGLAYENGAPPPRDLSKAHLYFNLAAARRHPAASAALQRVSADMSAEDVAKAQAAAKVWKATP